MRVKPPPDPNATKHIPRMDVLRALAFLSVYLFHFTGMFRNAGVGWNGNFLDFSSWRSDLLFLSPIAFGWLGVPLFFVISGFCIHLSTLRRKGEFTKREFYWRRFVRIYPAYIACVVGVCLLNPWIPEKYFNSWQIVAHVFLIHNFLRATFFGLNGSFWSLAVEAQFYLVYPVLLYLVAKWKGMSKALVLALVLNVVCQLVLCFAWPNARLNPGSPTWSFPLVTWCDWILGACLAESWMKGEHLFRREKTWLIFSALMLLLAVSFRPLNAQAFLFASVFSAVLIQFYVTKSSPLNLIERLLVPIGLVSYSLYLWHGPAIRLVDYWGNAKGLHQGPLSHAIFDFSMATLLLIPVVWLSYRYMEVGAGRLLRR